MGYAGEVLTAHVMFATADRDGEVVGLRSPGGRILKTGDGATAAVGYWGGLSARAGLIDEHDEDFLKLASAYFAGLAAWYATADIGVPGGEVFDAVTEALARGGLRSALNPGHLTGQDEWVHTPIRPGSTERIESGMPFQVDVIPTPMPRGAALNCEDGIVFADAALRAELRAEPPRGLCQNGSACCLRTGQDRSTGQGVPSASFVNAALSGAVLASAATPPRLELSPSSASPAFFHRRRDQR